MPHKHKRKRGDDDSEFNLPPTERARPLPVLSKPQGKPQKGSKGGKKYGANQQVPAKKSSAAPEETRASRKRNKRANKDDDVPRSFKRLMAHAQGVKFRSGLDDGNDGKPVVKEKVEVPKIQPGEDLRSFSFRVNAALPVAGLAKKTAIKDGKDELGIKVRRTRKERKMHKLYDQWHAEELKIKDQREEDIELAAEKEMDENPAGIMPVAAEAEEGGTGKKKKRRRGQADDDDPWAELKKKRGEAKIGLHDTAKAPPELNKKVLRIGAAVDVANVPKASGSLRRREELKVVRTEVVDAYRRIREHEQSKLAGA
ncbi:hypothetical protein G7046_g1562 [Stylonectria norvegica]|nr:hypothetical protein G7046_g1562 [Stylonectria norvegica]